MNGLEEQLKAAIKQMEGFSSIIDGKLTPINKAMEDIAAMTTAKHKKKISFEGKEGFVSLLQDGRVVVDFASKEDGENYFNKTWL